MQQETGIKEIKNNDLVDLIERKSLLDVNVCKALAEAKEFIASTYTDVPMYRPLPIKLFAVLSDKNFPTPEEKFWQCKVEAEVHANELIRDIHDLELAKIEIEKYQIIIKKMIDKSTKNGLIAEDIELMNLDIREQQVHLSRKRFEIKQVEKRIKYRIEEVSEWKKISESILQKHGENISPDNYIKYYVNKIKHNLTQKLKDESVTNKDSVRQQILMLDKAIESFS